MKICLYRMLGSSEVRVGASAPWDDSLIVDVHLAEVVWLSQRTAARRAYEIAESLVPAQPGPFLAAGAHVWDFAREAVLAATAQDATSRGERVAVDLAACVRVPVLDHLATSAERIDSTEGATSAYPALAIIRGYTHAASADNAWDHVAGYVDLAVDPGWLLTQDELGDGDSEVYCAVADLVSTASAGEPLLAGDIVCDASILTARRAADFEELLVSA